MAGERGRGFPEMSIVVPLKCETCRFWTEIKYGNDRPWGSCGKIKSNSRDKAPAYLTGEFATEVLWTLPDFYCSLHAGKLENSICTHCGEEIFFYGYIADWQHVKTELAVCAHAKLNGKGEWSHWATPKTGGERE